MNFGLIYLNENKIYYSLKEDAEIKEIIIPKNLINGNKIINYKQLKKYIIKNFMKTNCLNRFFFIKVKIITPIELSDIEKYNIRQIFNEVNIDIISFIIENSIFNNYQNRIYINCGTKNFYVHYKDNYKVQSLIFPNLLSLKTIIKSMRLNHDFQYVMIYGQVSYEQFIFKPNIYIYDKNPNFLFKKIYKMDNK